MLTFAYIENCKYMSINYNRIQKYDECVFFFIDSNKVTLIQIIVYELKFMFYEHFEYICNYRFLLFKIYICICKKCMY